MRITLPLQTSTLSPQKAHTASQLRKPQQNTDRQAQKHQCFNLQHACLIRTSLLKGVAICSGLLCPTSISQHMLPRSCCLTTGTDQSNRALQVAKTGHQALSKSFSAKQHSAQVGSFSLTKQCNCVTCQSMDPGKYANHLTNTTQCSMLVDGFTVAQLSQDSAKQLTATNHLANTTHSTDQTAPALNQQHMLTRGQ